ncbi:hypothetical protein [Burkholderia ubonensis]|uniref:Uncharacterized protein n=1 Tax=Burkholderia ubonensis TaxID=101571 RepID=A0A1R1JCP5_9BURK|nr:hypothetical protein [Burkholderia ubonensis]OMG73116.1 hypothetical protein BW685_12910 [Burkholderia ubonensis]
MTVNKRVYQYTFRGKDGQIFDVDLEIDMGWLVNQMARKAVINKGKVSGAMSGAIKCRAKQRSDGGQS